MPRYEMEYEREFTKYDKNSAKTMLSICELVEKTAPAADYENGFPVEYTAAFQQKIELLAERQREEREYLQEEAEKAAKESGDKPD